MRQRHDVGRSGGDGNGRLEGSLLVVGRSGRPFYDGAGATHAPARRSAVAGDAGAHRLGRSFPRKRRRALLVVAANLAHERDAPQPVQIADDPPGPLKGRTSNYPANARSRREVTRRPRNAARVPWLWHCGAVSVWNMAEYYSTEDGLHRAPLAAHAAQRQTSVGDDGNTLSDADW